MADTNIETYLNKIIKSVYGKDVRKAIHDAISECYSDVTSPALNEKAFKKQIEYKFQELIDDGTLTNLTIEDKSITSEKLSNEIFSDLPLPFKAYEKEILYDNLADISQLNSGSFVNNIPVKSVDGTKYFTDYIDATDETLCYKGDSANSGSYVVRVYDANKTYLGSAYKGMNGEIGLVSEQVKSINANAKYVVYEYDSRMVKVEISRNKAISSERLAVMGNEFSKYSLETTTKMLEAKFNSYSEYLPVLEETDYVATTMMSKSQSIDFYNASYYKIGTVYFEKNNGVTQTITTPKNCAYIRFGGGNVNTFKFTGQFLSEKLISPDLNLVPDNFNKEVFDAIAKGLGISVGKDVNETYYNCTKYGILPANSDNTEAMQNLINMIYENGGGTIWIPCGTYIFDSVASSWNMTGNITALLEMKSNVSIIGESINGTILKVTGNTPQGASLFTQNSSYAKEVLVGCKAENFTVDMSEASLTTYTHRGKAFYYSGIKDCIFKDLRLLETPSTSLGIDMLDNVVMDSVYVYKGGRQWAFGGNGGAGIGIGTGKWSEENYIIRNCVCDACGHFGIFLEDQGVFSATKDKNYSKGQIITNNVVRNGRHYGIGVRGGKNVLVSGNNIYDCKGGLYTDYGAKNVVFSNNLVQGSTEAGFNFGNEDKSYPCENIAVVGNTFFENAVGIKSTIEPTNSQKMNNVFIGNTTDEV
jgi:hypothetical protein